MIKAKEARSATVMPWEGVRVSNTGPSTELLTSIQVTATPTSPTANHLLPVIATCWMRGGSPMQAAGWARHSGDVWVEHRVIFAYLVLGMGELRSIGSERRIGYCWSQEWQRYRPRPGAFLMYLREHVPDGMVQDLAHLSLTDTVAYFSASRY